MELTIVRNTTGIPLAQFTATGRKGGDRYNDRETGQK
jgi:hypothetical protein